jgi:hypothetical protein
MKEIKLHIADNAVKELSIRRATDRPEDDFKNSVTRLIRLEELGKLVVKVDKS